MNIEELINEDLTKAMYDKDKTTLTALRGLKGSIGIIKTAKAAGATLTNEEVISVIQKQIKSRQEVSEVYKQQGREDLYAIEAAEVAIFSKYLPTQLTADEVLPIIQNVVSQVGATSVRDMGKVMGHADVLALAGKIDKKTLAEIIKQQF